VRTSRAKAEKTLGKRIVLPYLSWVKKERVYRRRRIGALFVAAVLGFALYAGGGAGAEPPTVLYTVEPGDTFGPSPPNTTRPPGTRG